MDELLAIAGTFGVLLLCFSPVIIYEWKQYKEDKEQQLFAQNRSFVCPGCDKTLNHYQTDIEKFVDVALSKEEFTWTCNYCKTPVAHKMIALPAVKETLAKRTAKANSVAVVKQEEELAMEYISELRKLHGVGIAPEPAGLTSTPPKKNKSKKRP